MPSDPRLVFEFSVMLAMVVAAAAALFLQRHPTRRRVWLPVGYLLLLSAAVAAWSAADLRLVGGLVGGGLMTVAASCRRRREIDLAVYLITLACAWVAAALAVTHPTAELYAAAACGIAFAVSLWLYRRPVGETLGEWLFRVMYRMRVIGPGVAQLPRTGPVLVIANHTAFLDPCWVMIPLPRDLTPIMYGDYFKKFGLHFYMKHIINAIPSGVGTVRREAPELDEVVRRLDRGEGVLVFPEGWVRRKEEEQLKRFAQGPWRILRDRPATPVVACWIEGGWGSWSSFKNGPPFKGKPIDIRRRIDIGVSAPVVLDAEILGDQLRTRELLWDMVLDARRHLAACGLAADR